MLLHRRTQAVQRRAVHIVHQLHRMRVAHRHGAHPHRGRIHIQRPGLPIAARLRLQTGGIEGQIGWVEAGGAHVHSHLPIGANAQLD